MLAIRRAALALGFVPIASFAWGADVTAEQAQAVKSDLRTWVATLLGPTIPVPENLIQLTPAGDHFNVAIPLGNAPAGPKITATARSLDNGKWSIDQIQFPSPAQFTVDLPQTTQPNGKPQPISGPVTYNVTFGQQSGQMLLDTTEKTASTFNSSTQNVDLHLTGENVTSTSHVDRAATTSILRPAENGRVSLVSDGTMEGYRIASSTPDLGALKLSMEKVRVTMEVNGVSNQRAAQLVQSLVQLGAAMGTGANLTPASPPKLDPKTVSTMLEALADLASGATINEQFENLALSIEDQGGTLRQAQLGFQTHTDQGIIEARMNLGVEGLALPNLPLGDLTALIPTKLMLQPSFSGVAVADLVKLAKDSQDGRDPPEADIAALFSHGGVSVGLDSFGIDVAGSTVSGMGKLMFASPDSFSGTAQITATNLDLLQQRVAASPELAQAGPVFIFLKGIGRMAQNQMVWDVSFRDGRLLVNNQDLSAMFGMAPQSPPTRTDRPARPNNRTRP